MLQRSRAHGRLPRAQPHRNVALVASAAAVLSACGRRPVPPGGRRIAYCEPALLHLDDVVGLPGLIEKGFERSVESEEREPAFAGRRLDPVLGVVSASRRRVGPEVDVDGTIDIRDRSGVAAHRRERLATAQDRAAVGVVGDDRPEVLRGDVRRDVQTIALAAVEESAGRVARRPQVLRAGSHMLLDHRRRHANGDVGEAGAAVGVDVALRIPGGRPADERPLPGAIEVDEARRIVGVEAAGAGNRRRESCRVVEERLARAIGGERLALLDADRGELEALVRGNRVLRFTLDHPG